MSTWEQSPGIKSLGNKCPFLLGGEQKSRNKSPGIKSPGNKSPSAAGGGMPGGTVGAIVAQPKDMEINIDRHKDRKTKAILLFVNRFILLTSCQSQLQFLNGVFPLT